MKKVILVFSIILVLFCTACTERKVEKKEKVEGTPTSTAVPYIDRNPIQIGLYQKSTSTRNLVHTYKSEWVLNQDLLVLSAFPVQKEQIELGAILDVFPKYWQTYSNIDDYKIGYFLEFKMEDGREFSKVILGPDDTKEIYNYMQVYLYDDIHQKRGAWYSHVEEMNEDTLLTTIKLTGSFETAHILSPMKLSVFTYRSDDDFAENGLYRGKSIYTIELQKQ